MDDDDFNTAPFGRLISTHNNDGESNEPEPLEANGQISKAWATWAWDYCQYLENLSMELLDVVVEHDLQSEIKGLRLEEHSLH